MTKRAVLIGLLLIPLSSFWITNSEMVTGVTEITSTSLFIGAVFLLFLLVLLNVALERWLPRYALSGAEMLTIYVMVTIGMSINGIGMFGFLVPTLLNPFWYATPENAWGDFHPYIPTWWVPQDRAAITHLYLGGSSFHTPEHLQAWATPILTWSAFTFALIWTKLCANALLRKRWMEQEQLAFPIAALPIEMSVRERRFTDYLRNRYLWMGFLLAAAIQTNNSLQFYYPQLPYLKVKPFDIGYLFSERPWNAIGYFPIAFHPCVIGLTYLIPLDVAFSCWFFYLFRKFQKVLGVMLGTGAGSLWGVTGRYPAIAEQGTGAWLGLALVALWMARRHLAGTLRSAWHGDKSDEPISPRLAWLGLLGGFAFLVLFCIAAGMRPPLAVGFFALFLLYMVGLNRIRSEGGVIWHFGPSLNPQNLTLLTVGSKPLHADNLTLLAYLQWFNLEYRSTTMPHQLEGFKIARASRASQRGMFWVMALAGLVGILAAYWNVLHMYYIKGAATPHVNLWRTNMGMRPYYQLRAWLDYPTETNWSALPYVAGGMGFTFLLMFLRTRLLWWPFHPLGYAVGHSFIIDLIWMPMAVSWALKKLILQTGGIRAYRRAMPFFIGLLLGDYVSACIFSLIGVVWDIPMYRVFPN